MIFYGRCASYIRKHGVKGRMFSLYRRFFGVEDPHSHIRWRAVWPMIEKAGRTLDVGCGTGVFTFDIAAKAGGTVDGLVYTEEEMACARNLREMYTKKRGDCRVNFMRGDILDLDAPGLYDQVLCIDVIEHIRDDEVAVAVMGRALKPGGYLIISTITKEYPKYFGERFHSRIGHVRDGYEEQQLRELLEREGLQILEFRHYGNHITRLIGIAYYKKGIFEGHPFLWFALHPLVAFLGLLEPLLPSKKPLGIALKARKAGLS